METTFELVKRHGSTHFVNIKYGYILLGFSFLFITVRTLALWNYQCGWRRSGRSTTGLRLVSIPRIITLLLIVLTVAILIVVKPHFENISVLFKRLGRLACALVPLNIFLASEPAWFSVDNYLNTIQLHKWISRIILVLAFIHSVLFIIFYLVTNRRENIFKFQNALGVIAFILSCIMLVFWKPIRDFNFRIFYLYHNIFLIAFIVLLQFHARPGVGFLNVINAALLIAQFGKKYYYAKDITMTEIIEKPGSDYLIVKFPKSLLPEQYLPACHIRLGATKWSLSFLFTPSHPYTVSNTYEDKNLLSSLIIKKTRFELQPFETYAIQPNFKSSLNPNFFTTAENVCIVCGGSGISLGVGIFEYFKRCITVDSRDIKLKFIWITKREEDLYLLKELNVTGVDVFVTSDYETRDCTGENVHNDGENGIPLTELGDDLDSITGSEHKFENIAVLGKRPDIYNILEKALSKTIDYANKWIVACGPPSLISDCQDISYEKKCQFFSEEYSF